MLKDLHWTHFNPKTILDNFWGFSLLFTIHFKIQIDKLFKDKAKWQ